MTVYLRQEAATMSTYFHLVGAVIFDQASPFSAISGIASAALLNGRVSV